MTTPTYPVAMALEDFVPTLLAFAGFWLLASSRSRTNVGLLWLGRIGACLIGLGGVAKSVWKLLVAGWQIDLPWLEGLLFPLMSVGAVFLLASLLRTYWVLLALPLAAWQPFIVATAGVTLISVTGIVLALRRRLWASTVLFLLGIAGVMSLVPLRSHPQHETVTFQWIEQGTNTAAQLCFLLAALLLSRHMSPSAPPSTDALPQTPAAAAPQTPAAATPQTAAAATPQTPAAAAPQTPAAAAPQNLAAAAPRSPAAAAPQGPAGASAQSAADPRQDGSHSLAGETA